MKGLTNYSKFFSYLKNLKHSKLENLLKRYYDKDICYSVNFMFCIYFLLFCLLLDISRETHNLSVQNFYQG